MFSGKKIAVVSALLGGLAITGAGITQAYAEIATGGCEHTAQGHATCVDKRQDIYTTKDGRRVIQQRKSCSSSARQHVVWPENGLLNNASTKVGPEVDCSNRVPAPRNFKLPHLGF
ncbi:hypothetical protein [Streptomyces sp. NPDC050355]|uniref:Secreted protein n=1 Tax=Streptomyces sirii TaxID=3127701 RepID=A0ABZ2QYN5_9ACTN